MVLTIFQGDWYEAKVSFHFKVSLELTFLYLKTIPLLYITLVSVCNMSELFPGFGLDALVIHFL